MSDALEYVLRGTRDIGCPSNQSKAWIMEFSVAIRDISRDIASEIAQAEHRIIRNREQEG